MSWGKVYDSTWWGKDGVCENTIGWGDIYKSLVDCTPTVLFEIETEDGNYMIAEGASTVYLVL